MLEERRNRDVGVEEPELLQVAIRVIPRTNVIDHGIRVEAGVGQSGFEDVGEGGREGESVGEEGVGKEVEVGEEGGEGVEGGEREGVGEGVEGGESEMREATSGKLLVICVRGALFFQSLLSLLPSDPPPPHSPFKHTTVLIGFEHLSL